MESPVFTYYPLTNGAPLPQLIGPATSRCGIYVLTFANGDQYVGQAKNVLTRFTDHYTRWGRDIHSLDFAPVAAQYLNLYEVLTIRRHLATSSGPGTSPAARSTWCPAPARSRTGSPRTPCRCARVSQGSTPGSTPRRGS